MAIRSIVHFDYLLNDQQVADVDLKVSEYRANGKSVSDRTVITYNGASAYSRIFGDEPTAQDFVDYIKTFNPGPVTAIVDLS